MLSIFPIVLINGINCNLGNISIWIQLMKNYGWNVIATVLQVGEEEIKLRYFCRDCAIMIWGVRLPGPEDGCVVYIDLDLNVSKILKLFL